MTSKKNRPPKIVHLSRRILATCTNEDGLWYESPEERDRALARSARDRRRLAWVRAAMLLVLTRRECQCMHLYYFRGYSLREVGALTDTSATSSHRAIQRGIRKLREAAREWQATHSDDGRSL